MSGRLDSNQRPPEPHSGGRGRESRKDRPFLNLQIPYFPYFTRRTPHFPQNPPSFLPFPTRGIRPCRGPEPGPVAPGAVSGEVSRVSAVGLILRSMWPLLPGPRERHQQRTKCSSVQIALGEWAWFLVTGADWRNCDARGGEATAARTLSVSSDAGLRFV